MKSKLAVAAALVAGTFMGISAANANPIYVGYKVGAGATTIGNSGNSAANFAGVVGPILFNPISATGSTFLPEPDLQSTQISARNTSAGTTIVKVFITETDLTAMPGTIRYGFANNGITVPVDIAVYMSNCSGGVCGAAVGDDVFDTTPANLVYSNTLAAGTGGTADVAFPVTVTGLYSQTLVYSFTLAAGQVSNANLSVTGIGVPEPLTLSLFGAGLAGMAAVRRRKQKQAA